MGIHVRRKILRCDVIEVTKMAAEEFIRLIRVVLRHMLRKTFIVLQSTPASLTLNAIGVLRLHMLGENDGRDSFVFTNLALLLDHSVGIF